MSDSDSVYDRTKKVANGVFNKLERKNQKGYEHSWKKKQAKMNSKEISFTILQATLPPPPLVCAHTHKHTHAPTHKGPA